jgi:hypothetical protein
MGEEGHAVREMRVMVIVALHRRKRGVVMEVEDSSPLLAAWQITHAIIVAVVAAPMPAFG